MIVEAPNPSSLLRIAPEFEKKLRATCEAIIRGAREGRVTSPAAEWLLGNFSYLRTQIREVRESLPWSYYRRLPKASESRDPRIFEAIEQVVSEQGAALNAESLLGFFETWQRHTVLSLSELWAIRPMLKIALFKQLSLTLSDGPLEMPQTEGTVRMAITVLRGMDDVIWAEFVESLCVIDRMLRNDPSGDYAAMDFETRDRYRRSVEEFARHSRYSEQEVAGLAVELARESEKHVGYYLIGDGIPNLRRAAHVWRPASMLLRDFVLTIPLMLYLGGAALVGIALLAWFRRALPDASPWWLLILLIVPASQAALGTINLLVSYFLTPRTRPRMDFRNGIPVESRTLVVVPTLLLSKAGIDRLIGNLEIYHLANRDRNLFFALLTDFPDAATQHDGKDPLSAHCREGIEELNRRYRDGGTEPFFLLHRDREWNASEGKWMGRERKRGKLDDFNRFLLGMGNAFSLTVGNLEQLAGTRYVITLDSDTQLPRDTAWKLVGTMAHPLNRPVFNDSKGIVGSGYALMQPRIGISMESAAKTRFSAIYSGQVGFDPYTTAVSDVYQDLFGRATFTGKGIYDVAAFERATRGRFPDNTLLSHDLIEGEHVRAGLITDLEMIDDYPSRYQAFSKRKHRWVRGDWQIAMWLLPLVPNAEWKWIRNPLPLISRWKMLDNLRRSLLEISYCLAFFSTWLFLGSDAFAATLGIAAFLLVPAYAEVPISLFRLPPLRFFREWIWTRISDFTRAHMDALLTLTFLPAQALLMADAVLRTLYRRTASHKNLLEWESMAEAEMATNAKFEPADLLRPEALLTVFRSWSLPERYLAASVLLGFVIWLGLLVFVLGSSVAAFTLTILWMASPAVMAWLNSSIVPSAQTAEDNEFLRGVALSTWRYFVDHEDESDHWLTPDNIQEDPPAIAHRTSPTNIGLQLNVLLSAHEFGYLTPQQFQYRLGRVHITIAKLERERGHFFNWYDTRTLKVLPPRFLSTVDSGNLLASLIVTRQGCLGILNQPLIGPNAFQALRDHLLRLRDSIPLSGRTTSFVRLFDNIRRQLEAEPDDLFFWEGVLSEVRLLVHELHDHVEWVAGQLEAKAPQPADEIRYWLNALTDRVNGRLHDLCDLAPWLCSPYETELRLSLTNPQLAGIMNLLRRVPTLGGLSALYDRIEEEIANLDAPSPRIHQSTLNTLRDLRSSLKIARMRWSELQAGLQAQADFATELGRDMDFKFLVDDRRKLLRIGWDADAGELASSSYDLLASEARTAVFLAIARGDAPREAWFHLGRKLTFYRGNRTLLSWSGTMFEYLMPALFMQTWDGTLLGESLRSVIRIQRVYARERRIPWGISESAHSGRDGALNYQYRAFGVPCCGADRIPPDDLVIAPYATVLSLMIEPRAAVENLRQMASRGWLSRYGFYEAIDFRGRARGQRRSEVIRAYMAHHQGMSFLSLANALLGNPIQKYFHSDPSVLATEQLLQERMPALAEAKAPEEQFPGLEEATAEPKPESAMHSVMKAGEADHGYV